MVPLIARLVKLGFSRKKALKVLKRIKDQGGWGRGPTKAVTDAKIKRVARKRVSKDLLSDAGFKRYQNNVTDSINQRIKHYEDWLRRGKGRTTEGYTRKYKALIQVEKDKLKHINSSAFKNEYNRIVKSQIDNIPITIGPIKKNWAGFYRSTRGMERKYRIPTTKTDPFAPRANLKQMGSSLDEDVLGKVFIKSNRGVGKQISTGAHELKHGVQSILKGYRDSIYKHVPMSKGGKPLLEARAELVSSVRGTTDVIDDAKYLLKPQEISARLTQFRTEPAAKRMLWEGGLIPRPFWYDQLIEVFGTKSNILKAAKDNWAVAPMAGLIEKNME